MSYLKDREIWLSSVPTGNPPAGYVWVFIQNGVFVVRDSNGVDKIMATTTGTVTNATSASYVEYSNVANKPALISGSSQVSYTGLSNVPAGIVSGSAQIGGYGVFATTGSNTFQANQTITGSLFITQNLVVAGSSSIQYISSSVLDIADNIITVNAFNPAIRFGGLAVIDSGSSPQVSGSLLFDSIKDQWIFVHQNQAVVTSSVVLMGPETYNDLGNESYISANRLPKGSGVEHLRDSNITDTGTVVSVNSNTVVTGSFTVVSGSAVELQVTNTGVRLGSALTDAHIVTGSLGVTGSLAIAGAGANSGIRVGSTDGGRVFIRQSVGGDAEIGAITNGGLFLYANNTLGLSFTGAAATFASTVTALGGYLYGQTVNSFVRLDNSIGSQIGYLNYADVTFDSDGLRFFTGTGTSGSRTQKLLLAASGAATFSSSVTTNGAKPQLYVNGDSGNGAGIHLNTSLSGANRRNWAIFTEENVDGDFAIKCSTAAGGSPGSGNTRLQISRDGNVGIGTTNPDQKLVVEGSAAILSVVDNRSFAAGVGGALYLLGNYRSIGDVTVAGYIKGSKVNSTDGDYGFNLIFGTQTYTGGVSEKMRIFSYGGVQSTPVAGNNGFISVVSATSIAYLSSLASTSDFSGYWQVGGNLAGTITHPTNTSTNYNTTSDYRLKENILPLLDGLESILKLNPLTGNYKSDPNKTNMPMFLAHEVQEVIPIAVTGEKDAMKINKETGEEEIDIQQLDVSKLIPHMVKAIQELKSENDNLKSRLEVLEQS